MVVEKKKFVLGKLAEEVAEWLKAADCKSVEFVSSEVRILFSSLQLKIAKYSVVVTRLLWEQNIVCSNHTISINLKRFYF
jgi:hypothetical protein